jgi:aspartate carbamoyltransferase catalytic subunit
MLLANYANVRLIFVTAEHPTLTMRDDLRQRLLDRRVRFYEVDSLEERVDGVPVIEQVDALYMTRVQMEHNRPEETADFAELDFTGLRLTPALVARMKEYAPILHPFPRDQHFGEIPQEIDNDPRAMYFRQARNGMWIRAALLAHIFDADHRISQYVRSEYGER